MPAPCHPDGASTLDAKNRFAHTRATRAEEAGLPRPLPKQAVLYLHANCYEFSSFSTCSSNSLGHLSPLRCQHCPTTFATRRATVRGCHALTASRLHRCRISR